MDFSLHSTQQSLIDNVAKFTATEITPHAADWDQQGMFPRDLFHKAAQMGLGGVYVDEKYGGTAMSRLDAALIFEQMAMGCVSTTAYLTVHNMVAWIIHHFGDDHQRAQYLPDLTAIQKLGAYALTEPNAGSDAASLQTKAIREGDDYILSGTKAFISGGGQADIYLIMARTGGKGAEGISAFIVEKNTKGLSFGAPEKKMGWKNQPTTMVMLDQCKIPAKNRVGDEGQGFNIAMQALNGGRINIAACSLGGAQACLNATKEYMQDRKQFGKALKEFQALQFSYAEMISQLQAARLMTYRAATKMDQKSDDLITAAAQAKMLASETGFNIADRCLQLHGGYGYLQDYPIERFFRDLRVNRILEGTNEIMRLIIAKHNL